MAFGDRWVPALYVRIAPDAVEIRSSNSALVWSDEAIIALVASPKIQILALGATARLAVTQTAGAFLCEPFVHPRCLISDYLVAEVFLKYAIRSYRKRTQRWFSPSAHLLLHPCPSPAQAVGRMTQVEQRAWRELGEHCGARKVDLIDPLAGEEDIQKLLRDWPVLG